MILSLYGLLISSAINAHAALPPTTELQNLQVEVITREGAVPNEQLDESGWNGVVETTAPSEAFNGEAAQEEYQPTAHAHGGGCGTTGIASYYQSNHITANGEHVGPATAAHRTLPMGTHVRVTNSHTGRSIIVRINDRGPFVGGRIIDLSAGAARALGMGGTATVHLECV